MKISDKIFRSAGYVFIALVIATAISYAYISASMFIDSPTVTWTITDSTISANATGTERIFSARWKTYTNSDTSDRWFLGIGGNGSHTTYPGLNSPWFVADTALIPDIMTIRHSGFISNQLWTRDTVIHFTQLDSISKYQTFLLYYESANSTITARGIQSLILAKSVRNATTVFTDLNTKFGGTGVTFGAHDLPIINHPFTGRYGVLPDHHWQITIKFKVKATGVTYP